MPHPPPPTARPRLADRLRDAELPQTAAELSEHGSPSLDYDFYWWVLYGGRYNGEQDPEAAVTALLEPLIAARTAKLEREEAQRQREERQSLLDEG